MEEGVIYHDEHNNCFYLTIDGQNSVIDYRKEGDVLDIYHTYVPTDFRGQGIASKLVQKALDHAYEHNYKVKPTCPFVATFIEHHEAYRSLVA